MLRILKTVLAFKSLRNARLLPLLAVVQYLARRRARRGKPRPGGRHP